MLQRLPGDERQGLARVRPSALLAVLMLLALVPALAVMPSMCDLPSHAARHYIEAFAGDGGPLDRYYAVRWHWIGYLGTDLPAALLTPWVGAEWSTRLVTALIAPATIAAVFALSRAAHGRVTAGAALALPIVLGLPYVFGLLNYGIGLALALFVAARWLARPGPSMLAMASFALAAVVVYTAHLVAWAVMVLMVAGFELASARGLKDLARRAVRALPLLAPCLPLLLWRAGQASHVGYMDGFVKWKLRNFTAVLRGLWMPLDVTETLVLAVLGVAAILLASGRGLDRRLAVAAGLIAITSLLMPTDMFGGWAADTRLAAASALIAFVAIGTAARPEWERTLFAAGLMLFAVRVAAITVVWAREDAVLERRLTLLEDVPRGSRMGYVLVEPRCAPWRIGAEANMGSYAVIRRDAFTTSLYVNPGSEIVSFRDPADLRWSNLSHIVPAQCGARRPDLIRTARLLGEMAAADFGTIWVSGLGAAAVPLPEGYRVVRAVGSDVLIGRVPGGTRRAE